jgi:DNA polymerase-3 subunit epsilon
MKSGFEMFVASEKLDLKRSTDFRYLLSQGLRFYRNHLQEEKMQDLEAEDLDDSAGEPEEDILELELTAEDVAGKFKRMFRRAGKDFYRSRKLTKLLNSHIEWESEVGWKSLDFYNGKLQIQLSSPSPFPWQNLGIADFDRMNILLNEISKKPHKIELHPKFKPDGYPTAKTDQSLDVHP